MQYKDVIRSVAYSQHEILNNIMNLYLDGRGFEADMTYSSGGFYGTFNVTTIDGKKKEITIPQPKYKFDVAPQTDDTVKIDPLGKLPLPDNSVESIVCDLPFVISCGPSLTTPDLDENGKRVKNNMIARRFATYYPKEEMFKSYAHWLEECYRVLKEGGILIFKSQPTISGSKNLMTTYYAWAHAEKIGFYTLDEFILLAKARLVSGKINKQCHARKFHSYFHVYQKNTKGSYKPIDYYKWQKD